MDINFLTIDKIPLDSFVLRVKGTATYIHVSESNNITLKDSMIGCFVCCAETANTLREALNKLSFIANEIEVDYFHSAYKMHGIVQKQMRYN